MVTLLVQNSAPSHQQNYHEFLCKSSRVWQPSVTKLLLLLSMYQLDILIDYHCWQKKNLQKIYLAYHAGVAEWLGGWTCDNRSQVRILARTAKCNPEQVVDTHVPVSKKQYNLVPANGQWYSAAGEVVLVVVVVVVAVDFVERIMRRL